MKSVQISLNIKKQIIINTKILLLGQQNDWNLNIQGSHPPKNLSSFLLQPSSSNAISENITDLQLSLNVRCAKQ